jgi:hypothetical protein
MGVRQPWPWLGLLLALLFLGHDLLMAVEATAAPAHGAGTARHATDGHGTLHPSSGVDGSDREEHHPEGCGVGQVVAPRIADESDWSADIPSASVWGIESLRLLAFDERPVLWQEPRWPAGIQRALFQVYRI